MRAKSSTNKPRKAPTECSFINTFTGYKKALFKVIAIIVKGFLECLIICLLACLSSSRIDLIISVRIS